MQLVFRRPDWIKNWQASKGNRPHSPECMEAEEKLHFMHVSKHRLRMVNDSNNGSAHMSFPHEGRGNMRFKTFMAHQGFLCTVNVIGIIYIEITGYIHVLALSTVNHCEPRVAL